VGKSCGEEFVTLTPLVPLHTSAYVSIRQHTSAQEFVTLTPLVPLHTSAYVSIRQHTSAQEFVTLTPLVPLVRAWQAYLIVALLAVFNPATLGALLCLVH
jgi:hypothetical protein